MRFNIEGEPMPVVVCEFRRNDDYRKGSNVLDVSEYADEYGGRRNWKNIWKNG